MMYLKSETSPEAPTSVYLPTGYARKRRVSVLSGDCLRSRGLRQPRALQAARTLMRSTLL